MTFDTAIIGAGVLGLWAARHVIKRGERVIVLEKRQVGAGASGGFLGALMPHMPDNWNAKKQFQFDGLSSLGEAVAALEADTGHSCGYRRCGRTMPLMHEKVLPQVVRRLEGAKANWGGAYEMTFQQAGGDGQGVIDWLNLDFAPYGIQHDTLSARINPRTYLGALDAFVRPRAELVERAEVASLSFVPGKESEQQVDGVVLASGERISAGRVIVANGWEAYPLLQSVMGEINGGKPIGRGVKGQAVLLEYVHGDDLPIVYHDGAYVVPHEGNRVAIGSTSVNDWSGAPETFDEGDMAFYHRAMELVPALRDAPIVGRWAGVRPRNTIDGRGTEPWFGPVPGVDGLTALIGGFKITLGLAHMASLSDIT